MRKRNFAVRTIRDGAVKINGKVFWPSERWLKYDGRLDGMRYAFGLYWGPGGQFQDFVFLWGREEMSRRPDDIELEYGPELVDGYFPWAWWNAVD